MIAKEAAEAGHPLDVNEACKEAGWPLPRTEEDLSEMARAFDHWGIVTNVSGEQFWKAAASR